MTSFVDPDFPRPSLPPRSYNYPKLRGGFSGLPGGSPISGFPGIGGWLGGGSPGTGWGGNLKPGPWRPQPQPPPGGPDPTHGGAYPGAYPGPRQPEEPDPTHGGAYPFEGGSAGAATPETAAASRRRFNNVPQNYHINKQGVLTINSGRRRPQDGTATTPEANANPTAPKNTWTGGTEPFLRPRDITDQMVNQLYKDTYRNSPYQDQIPTPGNREDAGYEANRRAIARNMNREAGWTSPTPGFNPSGTPFGMTTGIAGNNTALTGPFGGVWDAYYNPQPGGRHPLAGYLTPEGPQGGQGKAWQAWNAVFNNEGKDQFTPYQQQFRTWWDAQPEAWRNEYEGRYSPRPPGYGGTPNNSEGGAGWPLPGGPGGGGSPPYQPPGFPLPDLPSGGNFPIPGTPGTGNYLDPSLNPGLTGPNTAFSEDPIERAQQLRVAQQGKSPFGYADDGEAFPTGEGTGPGSAWGQLLAQNPALSGLFSSSSGGGFAPSPGMPNQVSGQFRPESFTSPTAYGGSTTNPQSLKDFLMMIQGGMGGY
jgi:hypothetical protein